jgi:hypothetical protein
MTILRLTGYVNTDGELRVQLPSNVPPGEVEVAVTLPDTDGAEETPWTPSWTDEEIRQMMQVTPKTGAEIAALLDEMEAGFQHITDSAAWVEGQRRSQKAGSQW